MGSLAARLGFAIQSICAHLTFRRLLRHLFGERLASHTSCVKEAGMRLYRRSHSILFANLLIPTIGLSYKRLCACPDAAFAIVAAGK